MNYDFYSPSTAAFMAELSAKAAAEKAKAKAEARAARLAPRAISRYLTLGNATVEVVAGADEADADSDVPSWQVDRVINLTIAVTCHGCITREVFESDGLYDSILDRLVETHYGREAQSWAQTHAEKCRAMPLPSTD